MGNRRKPNSDRAWRGRSFRTWAPMTSSVRHVPDSQVVKYLRIKSERKADRKEEPAPNTEG